MKLIKQYIKGNTCVEIWETERLTSHRPYRYGTVYVVKQYDDAKQVHENTTRDWAKIDSFMKKLEARGFRSGLSTRKEQEGKRINETNADIEEIADRIYQAIREVEHTHGLDSIISSRFSREFIEKYISDYTEGRPLNPKARRLLIDVLSDRIQEFLLTETKLEKQEVYDMMGGAGGITETMLMKGGEKND